MAPFRRAGASVTTAIGNSSSAVSVTIPAAAVVGDLAIITVGQNSSGGIAGWNKLPYIGTNSSAVIFWKFIGAGDPGSTVQITSIVAQGYTVLISVEVWAGALAPTVTFTQASGAWPAVSAGAGSIPIYVGTGYNSSGSPAPPSSITPPAGLGGSYAAFTTGNGPKVGLGVWFGGATTGTTAPGYTFGFAAASAVLATVILPPSQVQNVVLAGATSAQDQYLQPVLLGASAAQDVNLVWTP